MSKGKSGAGRISRWVFVATVAIPILSGLLVAYRDPLSEISTRVLVSIWVEGEVLLLVTVALITASARALSDRRRREVIRRLRDRAVRDPLTGLFNRRGLSAALPRTNGGVQGRVVVLLDLEGFKQVNDEHGHAVGDRVLQLTAQVLSRFADRGYLCARLGGDEFLLTRAGNGPDRAEVEEIIQLIPEELHRSGLPSVSATVGVASGDGSRGSFGQLVQAAEADLIRSRGVTGATVGPLPILWLEDESADVLDRGHMVAAEIQPQLDEPVVRRLRRTGQCSAVVSLLISLGILAGIALNVPGLRATEIPGAVSLATALTLAFGSSVMIYFFAAPEGQRAWRVCRFGGAIFMVVGTVTALEHLTGAQINPISLIPDPLDGQVDHIRRPDVETGLMFLLGGLYMAMIGQPGRRVEWARTAISFGLVALIAAAAFGFLLGAGYLWQGHADQLSPHGLLAGGLLAVALLTAQPRQPVFWSLTLGSDSAGPTRQLLVAGVFVPLLAGVLLVNTGIDSAAGWTFAVMTVATSQAVILSLLAAVSMRVVAGSEKETADLLEQIRELANRDPLTGLFDRGYMDREIERCQNRMAADGTGYAIALLDLDHLKQLNSSGGYAAGDQALRDVAAALASSVRPADLTARIGGDEFGILLPGADQAIATEVARRCAEKVRVSSAGRLSLSWGVAAVGPGLATSGDILAAADASLYESKAGRAVGTNATVESGE